VHRSVRQYTMRQSVSTELVLSSYSASVSASVGPSIRASTTSTGSKETESDRKSTELTSLANDKMRFRRSPRVWKSALEKIKFSPSVSELSKQLRSLMKHRRKKQ